jgi:hypothetical protein
MSAVSRRVFIKSSVLAVGVASLPLGSATAGAAPAVALGAARRHTFTALVATVAEANGARTDIAYLRAAADGFESWYGEAPLETRRLVERTLDIVETKAGRSFSRMSRRRRLAALHGWRHSRRPDARGLAYDAVTLAGSPFGPSPFTNAATADL